MTILQSFLILLAASVIFTVINSQSKKRSLEQENERITKESEYRATFYDLPVGVDYLDITAATLASDTIGEEQKALLLRQNRRVAVFVYPSDGLKVKGLVSFIPGAHQKTIIVLRGGNRKFGIPDPASSLTLWENYTSVLTTYRGGVSEGKDEFGGADVDDVKNLVDYLPELSKKIATPIQNDHMYMLGYSRGGMEMFLTLGRYPELQTKLDKIVSLSGMLDMRYCINSRPDMKTMFTTDFNMIEGVNEDEWINNRDPMCVVDEIRKDLPILIIQGTADMRVDLEEGYRMQTKLRMYGNNVAYIEIEGGDHCLNNYPERQKLITDWLEK